MKTTSAFFALALSLVSFSALAAQPSASDDAYTIDHRYAPTSWQTAICLPDDWQKTLVAKDGGLLYDYPGKYAGFATKITADLSAKTTWSKQELLSPRVPIVRTWKKTGDIEILEETFAAPLIPVKKSSARDALGFERVDSTAVQANWAKPPANCDPAFRNVAIGWGKPIHYRFKCKKGELYTVFFGICEGWHTNAEQRVLDLTVDGKNIQRVDIVAEAGRNVPVLYPVVARDFDDDGWIELGVDPGTDMPDKNAILNVLWIFKGTNAPAPEQLLAGQSPQPPLVYLACGSDAASNQPPRNDLMLVQWKNTGANSAKLTPTLLIETDSAVAPAADHKRVRVGASTTLVCPVAFDRHAKASNTVTLFFPETTLAPGETSKIAFGVLRGKDAAELPQTVAEAETLRKKAQALWEKAGLPYDHIQVPDAGIQALVDSSIRNIFQAREIKKGLPAFQVGPTCYRGLWVVDGSFLLEAMTYVGRDADTRNGIKYLMSFQREDGAVMLMDGHWKETGIALWAVTRHAKLTQDKDWLKQLWPKVERGFAYIGKMRQMPPPGSPNAGLIPDGFSDGGLADKVPEYTNIYWTMAGMRAAIDAALWLGLANQAAAWEREYADFEKTFRRAAERDTRTDPSGNRYVPIRMAKGENIPPQKAQWGFLHSIFPGKVFDAKDPLLQGNMAMLKAVECQGLVFDTGWLKDGIWGYFGSFYGHAWLWLGDGPKAMRTLYAFGNHASPLLVWREEQKPVGQGDQIVGDMPHNWASAEFIRLVRHCLLLERGNELHLFEGFPAKWAQPGSVTRLEKILTEFGPVSLDFRVAKTGHTGTLKLQFHSSANKPTRIVWHLDPWSGQPGTMDFPVAKSIKRELKLRH